MTKYLGTILHVVSFSLTSILLGILWWHFHNSAAVKSGRVQAAQGSATIYVEPIEQKNGSGSTVPVCEFNHILDDDVYRIHQDVNGKGIRVVRYIRRHNGTLDFVKEFRITGLRVIEDKAK